MKAIMFGFLVVAAAVLGSRNLLAQTEATEQNRQAYVQDGGIRQTLESIFIPPMTGAPFTCILHTEAILTTADGGTLTTLNQRKIARQGNGRIYQERWFLVPKNGSIESQMSHIQIADPMSHTAYSCIVRDKVCGVANFRGSTTTVYKPIEPPTGPLPDGLGYVMHEALGRDVTQGVNTVGTRTTKTINAWAMGNDRPLTLTREFWCAPSLGINLVSRISDPRFGSQNFKAGSKCKIRGLQLQSNSFVLRYIASLYIEKR